MTTATKTRKTAKPASLSEPQTFFAHNGIARASMAMRFDPRIGSVLLALSFANTSKGDVYCKRTARDLLNLRLSEFVLDTVETRRIPSVASQPNVYLVGIYDGQRTKNDIFGPLLDLFKGIGAKRNIDNERLMLHLHAQYLVASANHRLANSKRAAKV